MSFDSIEYSQSTFDNADQSFHQDEPRLSFLNPLQKATWPSSARSDTDWVSPFTLPPLPTFRRPRGDPPPVRSPDHLRDRSNSSAYYASAWGSPYATPSPQRSPPLRRQQQYEPANDFSSPLNPKHWPYYSLPYSTQEEQTQASEIEEQAAPTRPIASTRTSQSERPNWLSESEGSQDGRKNRKRRDTLTPKAHQSGRVKNVIKKRQSQESVETVTPDTFNVPESWLGHPDSTFMAASDIAGSTVAHEDGSSPGITEPDKPLPDTPPSETPSGLTDKQLTNNSAVSSRPRLISMQSSFARPKKKVLWKGKQCIIAFPLTDRADANFPPLLSSAEFQRRLDDFISNGYNINGFGLSTTTDGTSPINHGQSRPLFPDPADMIHELEQRHFHVHVPDQAEWNSWVEYLKEEKLRALGVSPSNSEPPASSRSPFSQPLSRTSSYMNTAFSPPMPPSSVASIPAMRVTSGPLSPVGSGSGTTGSHPGSVASPRIATVPGMVHAYKPPSTLPPTGVRMTSPYEYSISQPAAPSGRSPPGSSRQGAFSPTGVSMQSLGEVLSPSIGPTTAPRQHDSKVNNNPPGVQQLPLPHALQSPFSQGQQSDVQSSLNVPHHPGFDERSRTPPELAHPTPRSHRHNLSAALQKEIDDAEAALEQQDHWQRSSRLQNSWPANAAMSENGHDELPILRRPETLLDTDEKAEIETNPSMAASPMLLDDGNPFGTWQTKSSSSKPQLESHQSHKAQPSFSKLNVEAKEFNPSGVFSGASSGFGGRTFQPSIPAQQISASFRMPTHIQEQSSGPKFNIDAPSFTPGTISAALQPPSAFNFSSATFNVEAPAFDPRQSSAGNDDGEQGPAAEADDTRKPSIFGNVVIDTSAKATRRTARTAPNPKARSEQLSDNESSSDSESEEEDGRPTAPSERQKRARRAGSDGNQSPKYDKAAPFGHTRILSEILDDADLRAQDSNEALNPDDVVSPKSLSEESPNEVADLSVRSVTDQDGPYAAFSFKNERDAIDFSQARPNSSFDTSGFPQEYSPIRGLSQSVPTHPSEFSQDILSHVHGSPEVTEVATRSLATLAEPFEPLSTTSLETPAISSSSQPKERTSFGLEASRFATIARTPSPSPSLPGSVSTPPEYLYSYIKPEDAGGEDVGPSDAGIANQSMNDGKVVQDVVADDGLDTAEHPPVRDDGLVNVNSALATSQFEEPMPSYEEIDAVMKQFEENPELGVERQDTPVQSTPQIDTQPHLSTYVEPSGSSAQRAESYNEIQDTPVGEFPQLKHGLEVGVHKLNDGRDATSDWNDALSPTQEDKLEARAQFFDGHVNDLFESLLDNRLEPLERTLQTIQNSLALMATKPASLKRQQTTSTDNGESDADDEDDDEAVDYYAQYQARSPARGNRKSDRIKAAVAQALNEYQHVIQAQSRGDSEEIKSAISEFQETSRKLLDGASRQDVRTTLEEVISTHPRLRGQRAQQDHDSNDEKYKLHLSGLESMLQAANDRAQEAAMARHKAEVEIDSLTRRLELAEEQIAQHRESSDATQQTLNDYVKQKHIIKDLELTSETLHAQNDALQETLQEYRLSHDQWRKDLDTERSRNEELDNILQGLRDQLHDRSESREVLRGQIHRLREKMTVLVEDVTSEQIEWRKQELEHRHEVKTAQDELHRGAVARERLEAELATFTLEQSRWRELELHHEQEIKTTQDNLLREIVNREKLEAEFAALTMKESDWRERELEHRQRIKTAQDELHREVVWREGLEEELAVLRKEEEGNLHLKPAHDHAQEEVSRLRIASSEVEDQLRTQKDTNHRLERELSEAKEYVDTSVATATEKIRSELNNAHSRLVDIEDDRDAQIARLQSRLDNAELDLEEQKAKHETTLAETVEAHAQAIQDVKKKHEATLEEQHATQDKKFSDLRERHTRALHNSSDDRHRLENHLNERLALSEDKVKHLESKVVDLEDRLAITRSAARAAVEAANKKGVDIPTPAPSVVASPPQRAASASLSLLRGTDLPEKISPQALRESILVLQEQLQQKEHRVEQLEARLSEVGEEAPAKLKEREVEVTWLRELFGVRIDDLEEVIKTLTEANFDREAARDAAIRLKANLQMEQQIRERAGSSPVLPSALPSLSTLTSPRALPLAAAAAWGNWIKARDTSFGALSDLAGNLGSQTPSKPTSSPASFLSGMMTPPTTSQKTPMPSEGAAGTTPRPLAAAAAARKGGTFEARPLRVYSSAPRTLASRAQEKRASSQPTVRVTDTVLPSTPTINTDLSEGSRSDLTDDLDEDASPLETKFPNKGKEDNFDLTVR